MRFLSTLHVLLLCTARTMPANVSRVDDALIRASVRRTLVRLGALLSMHAWDTDLYAEPLHDVIGVLLVDADRRTIEGIVPKEFVVAMECRVLSAIKEEGEKSGEMFWVRKYEGPVARLLEAVAEAQETVCVEHRVQES